MKKPMDETLNEPERIEEEKTEIYDAMLTADERADMDISPIVKEETMIAKRPDLQSSGRMLESNHQQTTEAPFDYDPNYDP